MSAKSTMTLGLVLVAGFVSISGCQSTYFSAWEKLGYAKRDILVERVQDAKKDQEEAKQEFQTTLDQFKTVTGFAGGNLEAKYKKLNSDYLRCEAAAGDVKKRITAVETVGEAMFSEWKDEIKQYSSDELRRASQSKLRLTRDRYDQLIEAMKKAESKMHPVLRAFKDQVLFLKHNLNAQAIASLEGTKVGLEKDVGLLIQEMEASIQEANKFIEGMKDAPK